MESENSFLLWAFPSISRVSTCPDPEKEKTKYASGFPALCRGSQLAWDRRNTGAPGFWAFPPAGNEANPRRLPGLPNTRRSVPELWEASPGSARVQLKVVSHEQRASGNPGSGRWRARPEGAAQSTYMHRDPPDGCQEFPMRGAGGEVWATRPGQWRTSGGLCPFSPPPPASAPAARVFTERSVRGD